MRSTALNHTLQQLLKNMDCSLRIAWRFIKQLMLYCSVALAMDKTSGATDEVKMLRAELASRDSALAMVNTELNRLRRHTEQLNRKYQTALQKYDHQQ